MSNIKRGQIDTLVDWVYFSFWCSSALIRLKHWQLFHGQLCLGICFRIGAYHWFYDCSSFSRHMCLWSRQWIWFLPAFGRPRPLERPSVREHASALHYLQLASPRCHSKPRTLNWTVITLKCLYWLFGPAQEEHHNWCSLLIQHIPGCKRRYWRSWAGESRSRASEELSISRRHLWFSDVLPVLKTLLISFSASVGVESNIPARNVAFTLKAGAVEWYLPRL